MSIRPTRRPFLLPAETKKGISYDPRVGARYVFNRCLADRTSGRLASFGRIGPASCERFGGLVASPDDVPSYDDQGIRIRRQGRNDLDYSEDFGDDYWVKNGTTTVEPGYPDPRGGNNAYLVTLDPTVGNALWRAAVPGDPGAAYTASWHVRRYDVDGEVTAASADNKSGPRDTSSVNVTDEWQRVGVTHVQAADATGTHVILSGTQTTATRFLVFGAMRNPGERMDDYIPTNGAAATRLSEAADGDGNGLALPLADDMAAAMGELVQDANGNVLTPTGDELIDDVTAWQLNAGWSDDGVDAVSADGADAWSNAYKGLLAAGAEYIVTCTAVVNSGSFCFQGNTNGGGATSAISASGTYALKMSTNGVSFKVLALGDGFTGSISHISVKPVMPQYALSMTFVADIASADIDTPLSILGLTGVSRYDGIHADPDDVIRGGYIGLPALYHAGWQRGDRVKIVATVDAAADIAALACRVNDGDIIISQSSYAPDTARSISDAISICMDGTANDYIVPMSCVDVAMYPHAIPATPEAIANA